MKRKWKCNCDDLVRSVIERNIRGFIRKSNDGKDATDSEGNDVRSELKIADSPDDNLLDGLDLSFARGHFPEARFEPEDKLAAIGFPRIKLRK